MDGMCAEGLFGGQLGGSGQKALSIPCLRKWPGSQPLRQTQRSPEGPRHLHRIPRLSEAPWEVPEGPRKKARDTRVSHRPPRVLLQRISRP